MLTRSVIWLLPLAAGNLVLPNVPLPAQGALNGYVVGTGTSARAPSPQQLDVFLGPFCEDSRRMWPVIGQTADARAGKTEVRVHIFPLPYNIGSFLPAQACVASAMLTNHSETAVRCLDILYAGDNQKRLKTAALVNATTPQVIDSLVDLLAAPLGVKRSALEAQLAQGLESGASSYARTKVRPRRPRAHTRAHRGVRSRALLLVVPTACGRYLTFVSTWPRLRVAWQSDWKYGCSRGVFSTPSVFLNGVQVGMAGIAARASRRAHMPTHPTHPHDACLSCALLRAAARL